MKGCIFKLQFEIIVSRQNCEKTTVHIFVFKHFSFNFSFHWCSAIFHGTFVISIELYKQERETKRQHKIKQQKNKKTKNNWTPHPSKPTDWAAFLEASTGWPATQEQHCKVRNLWISCTFLWRVQPLNQPGQVPPTTSSNRATEHGRLFITAALATRVRHHFQLQARRRWTTPELATPWPASSASLVER